MAERLTCPACKEELIEHRTAKGVRYHKSTWKVACGDRGTSKLGDILSERFS